ncbi:hypothetical protein OS493_020081 [Desmophyllum pertusum]|uniref:Uncharacterized protein n=1 Tax=Desmophyllum pertusum TaxID=174260 RepID=A0A9W9YBI0_9CNID|nr:hypothetical protein OS493_020081 [Desmophyllum pertusum]
MKNAASPRMTSIVLREVNVSYGVLVLVVPAVFNTKYHSYNSYNSDTQQAHQQASALLLHSLQTMIGSLPQFVTIGTVLCLFLICAFVFVLYRYTHICKARGRQRGNGGNDFNVIGNPGPQIYRIQEEPVYAVVTDIFPTDNGNTGDSTKEEEEERPSVLLNPYLIEATFSRERPPLPSRPETEGSNAAPVYQNGGHEAVDQETDGSIVFTNREIEETSFTASPSSENDSNKLSASHEQDEESIAHDHQHEYHSDTVCPDSAEGNEEDLDYQGLGERQARAKRVCLPEFVTITRFIRHLARHGTAHMERRRKQRKRERPFMRV